MGGSEEGDEARDPLADPGSGAALARLLREEAGAVVMALGPGARIVPLPDSLQLAGQQVFREGLGLDLVVADDQVAVVEGWDRAQREPIVRLDLHLLADPDQVSTVSIFDVRGEHGVHVLVVKPQDHGLLLRSAEVRRGPRRGVAHVKKDAASFILAVDEATTSLLGWTAAELVGRSTVEFVHPDDLRRAIDNWMAVRTGQDSGPLRVRYRHAAGHHLWVEVINHNRLDDPEVGCVLSEIVDISAEMAQVEELRDRERLLARLADALPIGICHLRPDLQVVYSNAPLVALFGAVDSIDGLLLSILDTDRRVVEVALLAAVGGVPASHEVGLVRNVEVQRCDLTFRPMTTDGGSVDGAIVCATDVTERCRLRAELEHRAWHDPLTGCLNRAGAVIALERALAEAEHVAVAYIDLDDFKVINDELGHSAGDELLKVAAARLREFTRDTDRLGRLGGDEFVLICRQNDRPFATSALVERLSEAIAGDVVLATRRVRLAASVGAAVARKGEVDVEAVLHRADTAMYCAKRRRRRAADGPARRA